METIKLNSPKPLMIAHRGLSSFEKENTLAAFIAGGNHTYYGMECDIHPTTDGVFVVCHDENLKRVSGVELNVEEVTYDEVKNIDLLNIDGSKNYGSLKVPTLEEYVLCCKRYQKVCVIEFKNLFTSENVEKVLREIETLDYLEHCIFISFFIDNLRNVKKYQSGIPTQLLMDKYDEGIINICINEKMDIDILYRELDEAKVNYLHKNNIKINVWTVNTKEAGLYLAKIGVDMITTDTLE